MTSFVALMIMAVLVSGAAAEELTLDAAVETALTHHPRLLAVDAAAQAAGHDARQAGAWDNPAAFLRLENAPRHGDLWRDSGRIAGVAQSLPLFGVRGAARRAGEAQADIEQVGAVAARQALAAEVHRAHADARHAQQALSLRAQALDLARDVLSLVERQVETGDAARVSLLRARRAFHAAESELRAEESRLAEATTLLSSLIGRPLSPAVILPPAPRLNGSPSAESARQQVAAATIEAASAQEALARRQRWPELKLEAGLRQSPEGDGFDAGLRLSVPLWDRGDERIQAAQARRAAAEFSAAAVQREIAAVRQATLARRASALAALEQQSARVIPDAEAALTAIRTAHAAGDADLGVVLQVWREWIDARLVALDRERAVAMAEADLVALR